METPIARRLRISIDALLTRLRWRDGSRRDNSVAAIRTGATSRSGSQRATPQPESDPLASLARLIGQSDPFAEAVPMLDPSFRSLDLPDEWRPNVRQVPFKYHTLDHGPVFAFEVCAGRRTARCVTFFDTIVEVAHSDLLPFEPDFPGADAVAVLHDEIGEMMSPHMDGPSFKYSPPRRSTIGGALFMMPHIWNGAVYAPDEALPSERLA
jgi:hypothetical protein